MNILVTGGAGFIGSHLCTRLMAEGHAVACLDSLATGTTTNIDHLKNKPGFFLLERDVIQVLAASDLPFSTLDRIYNMACPASPPAYQKDPIQTFRTSVWGIWNLLELARQTGARILQASTSEIYGDPEVHPQPESYWGHVNPLGIRSCYDEGKRAAETLMMDHYRQYGTDIRVIRIFNTYGPHMDPEDGRVVSNFINQALQGEDLTIYGDGSQTRSFCYIDDLAEGIFRMMENPDGFIGPVNLGNPNEFTILELAHKVIAYTGSRSRIVRHPLPLDDPKMRRPDISLARQYLDWNPGISLDQGLPRTIEWYRKLSAR